MLLVTVNDKIMHGIYSKDRPEIKRVKKVDGKYKCLIQWRGKKIWIDWDICKSEPIKYIGSYRYRDREYFVFNNWRQDMIVQDSIVEDGCGLWAENYWIRYIHRVDDFIDVHTAWEFEGYICGYVILQIGSYIGYKNLFIEDEGIFDGQFICIPRVKEAIEDGKFEDLKKLYQLRKKFRFLGWVDLESALGSMYNRYLGKDDYNKKVSLIRLCALLYDDKIQEVILSGFSHPVMRLRKAWKMKDKVDSYEGHTDKRVVQVRNDSVAIRCCDGFYSIEGEFAYSFWGECRLLYELSRKYPLDRELDEDGLLSWAKFLKGARIEGREILDE